MKTINFNDDYDDARVLVEDLIAELEAEVHAHEPTRNGLGQVNYGYVNTMKLVASRVEDALTQLRADNAREE